MRCRKRCINLHLSGCILQYPSRTYIAISFCRETLQYAAIQGSTYCWNVMKKSTFFAEKTFMKNQGQKKEGKSLQ